MLGLKLNRVSEGGRRSMLYLCYCSTASNTRSNEHDIAEQKFPYLKLCLIGSETDPCWNPVPEPMWLVNKGLIRVWLINVHEWEIWAPVQYKDGFSGYGNFHFQGETVVRPSYLHMGIPELDIRHLFNDKFPRSVSCITKWRILSVLSKWILSKRGIHLWILPTVVHGQIMNCHLIKKMSAHTCPSFYAISNPSIYDFPNPDLL